MKQLIALFLIVPCLIFGDLFDPEVLYLTWQNDPLTTMTINWLSPKEREHSLVEWRESTGNEWQSQVGEHQTLPGSETTLLHRAEITNLKPSSTYVFRTGPDAASFKFQTPPANPNEQLRFVVGGDIYHDTLSLVEETNREAAKTHPHFALLGGDIAYAGSKKAKPDQKLQERWVEWLKSWKKTMVTPSGYLIPMVAAIGNHDVNGGFNQNKEQAPFYYTLFNTNSYRVLDFGASLSLILLDTKHTHPIQGAQTQFLANTLKAREHVPHKFAIYHVPAYPSVRKYGGSVNQGVRKNWVPLFEAFGLSAAFENHEHAYKRTVPLLNGKKHPNGVIYLGDGCWGVEKPRRPRNRAYIAKSAPTRHFILVTVSGSTRTFSAITPKGVAFDHVIQR